MYTFDVAPYCYIPSTFSKKQNVWIRIKTKQFSFIANKGCRIVLDAMKVISSRKFVDVGALTIYRNINRLF